MIKKIIREVYSRRSLLRELIAKDLKARYKMPVLSFFWAFLSPLFFTGILYLIFSVFMKINIQEAPFLLYLMSAVFTWRFFQEAVMTSATSLMDNRNLIKEASFPHYLVPLSLVLANLLNFLPSLGILIALSFFISRGLPIFIIFLPAVLVIHFIITFGMALIFSILYIRWRDTKYVLEILLQALFYLTPVFYSLALVKEGVSPKVYSLYLLNPFVGILNLYRLALLKGFYQAINAQVNWLVWAVITPLVACVILFLGFFVYAKSRKYINDYLAY
ncbi:MAG: ABC transporter permease [Candidatus Omnitrophica bacterium]|nr:ABC transporter permease [Candidatus Omnitrophota bacterium]